MQKLTSLALTACVSALAFGSAGVPANAADMGVPQGEYQGQYEGQYGGQYQGPPADDYGPPPAQEGYAYPPPAGVYGYPPPPAFAYAQPPVVVYPGPYYAPGPYWRGYYGPRFAYGYGHWGRGYRRW